jgi:hypothetical protein
MSRLIQILIVIGTYIVDFLTRNPGTWTRLINFLTRLATAGSWIVPLLTAIGAIWTAFTSFFSAAAAAGAGAGRWIVQVRKAAGGPWIDPLAPFMYLTGLFLGLSSVISAQIRYEMEPFVRYYKKNVREMRPDLGLLLQFFGKNITTTAYIKDELADLGFRDGDMDAILRTAYNHPGFGLIQDAIIRGEYGKDEAFIEYRKLGIEDTYHDRLFRYSLARMTIDQLLQAVTKGWLSDADYELFGQQLGYDKRTLQTLKDASGEPLSVGQLLELQNRAEGVALADAKGIRITATESEYRDNNITQTVVDGIKEGPLNNRWIPYIQKLRYNLLGISDYIRFAVREAFQPREGDGSQIAKEYPAELSYKARMLGYSPEDAFAAWAAHYELPSPTQVYTMLHRGLITSQQVQEYLFKADYLPEWRQLLSDISYNTLTRTDAKRAFKIGVLNEDQLRKAYMDEGYTEADAQILVDFAKADILGEKRSDQELLYGPIKSTLLSMYKARRIDRTTLEEQLTKIGFTGLQTEMFVQQIEFARQVDAAEDVAAALKGSYTKGLRSREDTKQLLINAGYDDAMAEQVLEPWDLLRQATDMSVDQKNQRDLTQSQVITAIMDGIIPEDEGRAMIIKLGYDDNEATVLIETAKFRQAEQDRKDSIELIHQQFLNGQLQSQDAAIELDRIRTPATQKAALLLRWTRERNSRSTGFTYSQLKDFFLEGTMGEGLLYYYLRNLGYNDMDISFILVTWDAEKTRTRPALKKPISRLTRKDAEALYLATPPQKDQAIKILQDLGYTVDDIAYIREGLERALKAQKG